MEGFFERADLVAEAMAFTTIAITGDISVEVPFPPFEAIPIESAPPVTPPPIISASDPFASLS